MLSWWYPDGKTKGMGWHRDGYGGNDGDEGASVWSLTIGNSCLFQWRLEGDETKANQTLEIRSGEMIVFGGPQRMIRHRVQKVLCGTCPEEVRPQFDVRINLTFRTLSEFSAEDTKAFRTDAYSERLQAGWDAKQANE